MDNIREKLVKLIHDVIDLAGRFDKDGNYELNFGIIADQLIAHGVTVLPCKVGDAVWGIKKYNRGYAVKQGVAYQMYFGENMRLCICVKNVCRGEWGANVFATQKEAEQALPTPPKGE